MRLALKRRHAARVLDQRAVADILYPPGRRLVQAELQPNAPRAASWEGAAGALTTHRRVTSNEQHGR